MGTRNEIAKETPGNIQRFRERTIGSWSKVHNYQPYVELDVVRVAE
jgi:hypothetical protein